MLMVVSPTNEGEPLSVACNLREYESSVSLSRGWRSRRSTVAPLASREKISSSRDPTAREKSNRALEPSSASVA